MSINPINQGIATTQTTLSPPASGKTSTKAASSASTSKSDTAIISQKAKDFAAFKAGKAMQEELNESMSAKLQEADSG